MKLCVVDSIRKDVFVSANVPILNLNSLIKRFEDIDLSLYKNQIQNTKSLNPCNLAGLCYRLKIEYGSDECLDIVKRVRKEIKKINKDIILVQSGIENYMEVDLQPYKQYYKIENETLYVIKPIKEIFNLMGYTDTQIKTLITHKNIIDIMPKDLIGFLNNDSYLKVKEVLWSMDT